MHFSMTQHCCRENHGVAPYHCEKPDALCLYWCLSIVGFCKASTVLLEKLSGQNELLNERSAERKGSSSFFPPRIIPIHLRCDAA